MLDVLLSPQILGLLFLALVIIGVIVVVIRRRRGQAADVAPPVDIGEPVDYTSIPYEEPTSLGDRFRNASPIVKALVILVPLLVIGGLIALAMTLTPADGGSAIIPPPPPPEIAVTRAEVAGNGKILIVGTTNLPNDGTIKASLLENREPFAWFNPETATTKPDNGKFTLTLDRAEGAPVPQQGNEYMVVIDGSGAGQSITSQPAELVVLQPFEADFYQTAVAVPTATPTPAPQATAVPQPTAEPSPTALTASVLSNGKIRSSPSVSGSEVGDINQGDTVTLLERSADGSWYRVQAGGSAGWVSSALLEVRPEVAAQIPTPTAPTGPTTTVFNGGNVRPGPGTSFNPPLDQINAGETVQLLGKTADGTWFRIVNERSVTGWVSRTLLNLSIELTRDVPVVDNEGNPVASATPAPVSGLTAPVFNGGNVRPGPGVSFNPPLDQINAGETVQLLAKNADGTWFQITTPRNVTGWVSVTLLTIDPATADKVPVSQ